ncbi:MAG: putative endonuclease [Microgenomates group bacterium Gr01-1014_16]|nr:MAG: putative endonuclease [Microgenomates group bacterium Gr01-1014_16]
MKQYNREIGRIGEAAAEELLVKKGLELILRNFSTRFGEVDLIMRDGERLVFVEVKTKKGLEFGTPEEMFTRGKYNKVKRMATVYLKGKEAPCRIDMVAVELDDSNLPMAVRHYENVVLR